MKVGLFSTLASSLSRNTPDFPDHPNRPVHPDHRILLLKIHHCPIGHSHKNRQMLKKKAQNQKRQSLTHIICLDVWWTLNGDGSDHIFKCKLKTYLFNLAFDKE